MADRDKTITITSHLHFASAVSIVASCCCGSYCSQYLAHMNVITTGGGEYALIFATGMETRHQIFSNKQSSPSILLTQ